MLCFLSTLMIMPLFSLVFFSPYNLTLPLLLPPFTPSPPLYYLKIRGVIARLIQIFKLGLITFLSTNLLLFFSFRFSFPSAPLQVLLSFWR